MAERVAESLNLDDNELLSSIPHLNQEGEKFRFKLAKKEKGRKPWMEYLVTYLHIFNCKPAV